MDTEIKYYYEEYRDFILKHTFRSNKYFDHITKPIKVIEMLMYAEILLAIKYSKEELEKMTTMIAI